MDYLDVAIGFTLIMGVLAGSVTALVQLCLTWTDRKKANVIETLRAVSSRLERGAIFLSEDRRWEFIRSALNDPTNRDESKKIGRLGEHESFSTALQSLKPLAGIHARVSTEHVLRALVNEVNLAAPRERLEQELDTFIQAFEAMGSSVSEKYKRHAQRLSYIAGIVFAITLNVNAFLILETLLAKPDIALQVEAAVAMKDAAVDNPEVKGIGATLEENRAFLTSTGMPVGWTGCLGGRSNTASEAGWFEPVRCFDADQKAGFTSILMTAVSLLLTGLLLGLGAPFWFDLARQLASVRSMFSTVPRSAEASRGKNANGNPAARMALVNEVLKESDRPMHIADKIMDPEDGSTLTVKVIGSRDEFRAVAHLRGAETITWCDDELQDGARTTLRAAQSSYGLDVLCSFHADAAADYEVTVNSASGEETHRLTNTLQGKTGKTSTLHVDVFMALA